MKRARSQPVVTTPNVVYAARLRFIVRGDLRAMTIPDQDIRSPDSALPGLEPAGDAGRGGRLGDYLRARGLITEHDLAQALAEQRQRIAGGQPSAIGDLLVELGCLTTRDLVTVLMLQHLDR